MMKTHNFYYTNKTESIPNKKSMNILHAYNSSSKQSNNSKMRFKSCVST